MSEPDPRTLRRTDFDAVRPVPTRWSDNDMFGHLNNAVYLELFDSVLNAWMQEETGIDEMVAPTLGVVAETSCRYYREVAFPTTLDVGVRAKRIGTTSVVFEFGVFSPGVDEIAAHGLWAQVYVDRETRRPVPIPDAVRTHLEAAVATRAAPLPPLTPPGARAEHERLERPGIRWPTCSCAPGAAHATTSTGRGSASHPGTRGRTPSSR
jgi:acyl-CoA thioester hydrolase